MRDFDDFHSANLYCTTDERGVETITLARSEKLNALSFETLKALSLELRRVEQSDTIRVVVLTGEGANFCAGLDLREASDGVPISYEELAFLDLDALGVSLLPGERIERGRIMPRIVQEIMKRIQLLPQIVVGRARGIACGGGAGLLTACDYVSASRTFRLWFSEVSFGFYPTLLFPFLSRRCPISKLREVVLTCKRVDAEFARTALGIVDVIDDVEETSDELAKIRNVSELFLKDRDFESLRETKRLFASKLVPPDEEIIEGWKEHWRSWNRPSCREKILRLFDKN